MDPRHLQLLLDFERLGSMRETAHATGYSTSSVSAQFAALERTAGIALFERHGRGVRLTPAGQRLAGHARSILAAVDSARADLASDAPIAGTVRVAGYTTVLARECLQAVRELAVTHPDLRVELYETEPQEAFAFVEAGTIDLAFVYDYSLVPHDPLPGVETAMVVQRPMTLVLPDGEAPDLHALKDRSWIVNSRGADDEELLRRVAANAGFVPDVRHRADALDLVLELVAAGLGVALLPQDAKPIAGVRKHPAGDVAGTRRMMTAVRPGQAGWPPIRLLTDLVGRLTES